jgi:hypothetical protein
VLLANECRKSVMVKLLLNVVDYIGEEKCHVLYM